MNINKLNKLLSVGLTENQAEVVEEYINELLKNKDKIIDKSKDTREVESNNLNPYIQLLNYGSEGIDKSLKFAKYLRVHRYMNNVHIAISPNIENNQRGLFRMHRVRVKLDLDKNYNDFIKENNNIQIVRDFKKFVERFE